MTLTNEFHCTAAIFIDEEDDETKEYVKESSFGEWAQLPDLVIEKVFSYLSITDRFHSSLVCKPWYEAFHMPYVWSTFTFEEKMLSRKKFMLYTGWQYSFDKIRGHIFLDRVRRETY